MKEEKLRERSILSVKVLAATIYYLVIQKGMEFDLLISIGNSGLFMSYLTKIVFKIIRKPTPYELRLPIFRYKSSKTRHSLNKDDWFDNSQSLLTIKNDLKKIKKIKNILIVDDEIGLGVSVRSTIDLVKKSIKDLARKDQPTFTILAEDHGFKFDKEISKKEIRIYSIGKQIPWEYHIITFHIPEDITKRIKSIFKRKNFGARQIANIIAGLPVKSKTPKPHFTDKYNVLVSQDIGEIDLLRNRYQKLIKKYLSDGIFEYKSMPDTITILEPQQKVPAWKLFYS